MQLSKGALSPNINTYFFMMKTIDWWARLSGEMRGVEFFLSLRSGSGKRTKNSTEKCAVGVRWAVATGKCVRESVGPEFFGSLKKIFIVLFFFLPYFF